MKTLEDEQYVVIKAYKFTVFEIWRDFNVLSYIACPRYPYIRESTDSMMKHYRYFFKVQSLGKGVTRILRLRSQVRK